MVDNSYLIIDRIEGDIAICEDSGKNHLDIPMADISGSVKEGDLLYRNSNGSGYVVDSEETERRRRELFRRQSNLFHRNGGKDTK